MRQPILSASMLKEGRLLASPSQQLWIIAYLQRGGGVRGGGKEVGTGQVGEGRHG